MGSKLNGRDAELPCSKDTLEHKRNIKNAEAKQKEGKEEQGNRQAAMGQNTWGRRCEGASRRGRREKGLYSDGGIQLLVLVEQGKLQPAHSRPATHTCNCQEILPKYYSTFVFIDSVHFSHRRSSSNSTTPA